MQRARAILVVGLAALVLAVSGVAVASASHPSVGTADHHAAGPGYTVTFSETGLPSGTNWSVRVVSVWGGWGWHHAERNSSTGSSISFTLPNGTYRYLAVSPAGFATSDGRGFFNVTGGSPPTIGISYTALPTYSVTFHETGLAPGTNWTVSLSGRGHRSLETQTSDTENITFLLTNGSYRYHVVPVAAYAEAPARGHLTVSGSALAAINVTFGPLAYYAVTFNESGLPNGTNWTVAVFELTPFDGGFVAEQATSSGSTITFNLTNGTYYYHVEPVPGWYVTGNQRSGIVTVAGASPPETSVTFAQIAAHSG
jgi:hypothetical protein